MIMVGIPSALRAHLADPSLAGLWQLVRRRLEHSGHAVTGVAEIELDEEGADRLGGLLGRPLGAGRVRVRLADLDTALRNSAAAQGLVPVVAALTGSPVRDLPAERASRDQGWDRVWSGLDDDLVRAGLAAAGWLPDWLRWLHGGVVRRLGVQHATVTLRRVVAVLAEVAPALDADALPRPTRMLGELASRTTGSAHGLDEGKSAAALVLRAGAIALGVSPPADARERRLLWQRLGVETDAISSTVLTWQLRPPGTGPWSAMMRERADLGLVTHLSLRELDGIGQTLLTASNTVHACENPQVLQAIADAGVEQPVICLSGNPGVAGLRLVGELRPRYHGDFDWPGVGIATRVFGAGGQPWRMSVSDYRDALVTTPSGDLLPLEGAPIATAWDTDLGVEMIRRGAAVHEEAVIETLIADLRQ